MRLSPDSCSRVYLIQIYVVMCSYIQYTTSVGDKVPVYLILTITLPLEAEGCGFEGKSCRVTHSGWSLKGHAHIHIAISHKGDHGILEIIID